VRFISSSQTYDSSTISHCLQTEDELRLLIKPAPWLAVRGDLIHPFYYIISDVYVYK
jgi:hypothetical protein